MAQNKANDGDVPVPTNPESLTTDANVRPYSVQTHHVDVDLSDEESIVLRVRTKYRFDVLCALETVLTRLVQAELDAKVSANATVQDQQRDSK